MADVTSKGSDLMQSDLNFHCHQCHIVGSHMKWLINLLRSSRRGGSVVDITLLYQSRDSLSLLGSFE